MSQNLLYATDGKIYAKTYLEIYIPMDYFNDNFAENRGAYIETIGLLYIKGFNEEKEGPIQLLNIPTVISIMSYDYTNDEISIHGHKVKVLVLKYLKDSYVLHQSIEKGKNVAESFLNSMLMGKLPKTLDYAKILDIWWKNLEISGVSFKVPSKIYEMIISNIYRSPKDIKKRFGEYYGRQASVDGYDYQTGDVRTIVGGLSTFSGMIFEDMNRMITNGLNNSLDEVEEQVSPLEKIIYY